MIITTNDLKSAIRNRKSWKDYDWEKVEHKLWMDRVMEKINRLTSISADSNYIYSNIGYTIRSFNYHDFGDLADRSVYRPLDPRDIEIDMPNVRTDNVAIYDGWEF